MEKAFPYIALLAIVGLGVYAVRASSAKGSPGTTIIDRRHRTDAGDILGGIGELAQGVGAGIGAATGGGYRGMQGSSPSTGA